MSRLSHQRTATESHTEALRAPVPTAMATDCPAAVLALQRTAGNRAVRALLARTAARTKSASEKYQQLIAEAERYGLPVQALKLVAKSYSFREGGDDDYIKPLWDLMNLRADTLDKVGGLRATGPKSIMAGSGLATVYHESTHAWLDVTASEKLTKEAIAEGERHYQAAPLVGGRTGDNADRLLTEAAGEYVGHRVAAWWAAFNRLSLAAAGEVPADKIEDWIEETRSQYDSEMNERTFGYEMEGGLFGVGGEQVHTTKPMSDKLKSFLDSSVLENKIPERFDDVSGFPALMEAARGRGRP